MKNQNRKFMQEVVKFDAFLKFQLKKSKNSKKNEHEEKKCSKICEHSEAIEDYVNLKENVFNTNYLFLNLNKNLAYQHVEVRKQHKK